MAFALILLPFVMAALAAAVTSNRGRTWLLPLAGTGHLALTIIALLRPDLGSGHGWLVLDPPGRIILLQVSVLYLLCGFYAVGYLRHRQGRSNRVFCVCLLSFLGTMSLVTWAHHLGLMWVGMEATTLVTAPLIYF